MPENTKILSIYISYAWNPESEKIVGSIEKAFRNSRAKIIRDKRDLKYKGRIKDFMKDLGLGKYVIVVISNKYLRSENCMFELLQIFKNDDFYERIFPLVLDDVNISKAGDRLELVKYWENEAKVLDDKIRELKELSNIQGVADDLNLYTEIRNNIARLTNILKDINTLNVEKHISSDFQQLYTSVENKIKSEFKENNAVVKNTIQRTLYTVTGILVVLLVYISLPTKNDTKKRRLLENPLEPEFYIVKLVVTPTMKDGKVTVNNEPATVLKRNNRHIFVRLLKKNDPYRFEVKNNIVSCKAEQAIEKDSIELTMSCNPIKIVPIQFFAVTLIVPSSMANENVFVDGRKAEILDRTDISITLRLSKKGRSHHFEIKKNNKKCFADKLIDKDSMNFALNCNF